MNIATLTSLAGLVAAAFLLGACQQSSTAGAGQAFAYQQKASEGAAAWEKRHCCRRGGRNGGGNLK
jgi:putative hemolysin